MKHLILLLAIHAFCLHSFAQSNRIKPPERPQYETCGSTLNAEGQPVPDYSCLNRNKIKERDYNYAVNSYNRAQNMISSDSTFAKKPVEPKYAECQFDDGVCNSQNTRLRNEYNLQMQSYNRVIENQTAANNQKMSDEQKRFATVNNTTTTGLFNEIERTNKEAQDKYNIASQMSGVVSQGFSAAFGASCATGCEYGLLAASVAFSVLQGIGGQQSAEHGDSAFSACNSFNSTSSSSRTCEVTPVVTDPSVVLDKNFDSNGNCKGDANICQTIKDNLPPGVSVKDVRDRIAKNLPPGFKKNPDGSYTLPNGKTYKQSDFASEEAMRAAGMSAADAKMLAGLMGKNNPLAKAGTDLQGLNDLDKSNLATGIGSSSNGFGGSGSSNSGLGLGSADGGKLGVKSGLDKDKNRKPAAEGLIRNFNGESIGVAGEDIFIMMNRRYKLKTAQDSFIGQ